MGEHDDAYYQRQFDDRAAREASLPAAVRDTADDVRRRMRDETGLRAAIEALPDADGLIERSAVLRLIDER